MATARSAPGTDVRGARPDVVHIRRHFHSIAVPWGSATPLEGLAGVRHRGVQEPGRGFRILRDTELPGVLRDEGPRGRFLYLPAGLESAARALLERGGFAVVVGGTSPAPLPEPDELSLRGAGVIDRPLLEFIRGHDRGLVRVGPKIDPARLAAQVALAFPGASIAVVAARIEDVRRLHAALGRQLRDVSWVAGDRCPESVGRVAVSTCWALGHPAVHLERRDVVIALDAVEATGRKASFSLHRAFRARLFGLLGDDRRPAPREADLTAGLFGFDELALPRHGGRPREVEVVTRKFVGGPAVDSGGSLATLKRTAYWGDPLFNRRAAAAALDAVRGGRAEVAAPGSRAAVLVENVEHALALAARLPAWGLVADHVAHGDGLPRESAGRLRAARNSGASVARPRIVTLAALAEVDLGALDVLVRADGGLGVPSALASIVVGSDAPAAPLRLVDFDDRRHPELRRRSRGRRAAYAGLGWPVDGRPAPTPVERFLAGRPGGVR
ncbi:hypothetical protein [Paludisphaera soli]|uniref:hypothetical protein n=1 Tax=Paludisphaera soli TaxID=2712865 RepID=UPI0013EBA5A5|nr:hypothetical protein [Paludisphaera soli]